MVGYAGGTSDNPTYHNLGGHSETVQIEYDPLVITYEQLLDVFWSNHNPTFERPSQYMSKIFYHNQYQKETALASKESKEKELGRRVVTEIVPHAVFYPAEDYHQKYYLSQMDDLENAYRSIYPDKNDFVSSTAVARINGYIGRNGSKDTLEKELDLLGLTQKGKSRLMEYTQHGISPACRVG